MLRLKGVDVLLRARDRAHGIWNHSPVFIVCFLASQFSNYPSLSLHLRDKDKVDSGKNF